MFRRFRLVERFFNIFHRFIHIFSQIGGFFPEFGGNPGGQRGPGGVRRGVRRDRLPGHRPQEHGGGRVPQDGAAPGLGGRFGRRGRGRVWGGEGHGGVPVLPV